METAISAVIGMLAIVIAVCSATIANAITHSAEIIAKAIKEKK